MSADNWGTCPNCKKKALEGAQNKLNKVQELYGKISSDDYTSKLSKAQKLMLKAENFYAEETTLREDYECSIDSNGKLFIYYSGACEICGFSKTFQYEEQLI